MANQIQTLDANLNQIQAIGEFGVPELLTMKETIGKDLTIPQFNLFMYQCNRMGLDPALKHAWPILYNGKMDSRIAYEGYLALAKKSDGYQGVYNQVVCDNEVEDFEAETDEEGIITRIKHKIRFPRGKVVGAYSIAKREGKKDFIVLMDVLEVQRYLKGQNQKFWKMEDGSPDPDMFKKHAGTRAIKGQYDIASVVEENMEALNASDNIPAYTQPTERRDITPEVTESEKKPEPAAETEADKIKAARRSMTAKFKTLGITTDQDKLDYIVEKAKPKGDAPTLAEMQGLLKIMDMEIAQKAAAADDLLEPVE